MNNPAAQPRVYGLKGFRQWLFSTPAYRTIAWYAHPVFDCECKYLLQSIDRKKHSPKIHVFVLRIGSQIKSYMLPNASADALAMAKKMGGVKRNAPS